jgi:hypothetical protein
LFQKTTQGDNDVNHYYENKNWHKYGDHMANQNILNWTEWQFDDAGGPIEFRITTNPDTSAGVKFFWYPDDQDNASEQTIRAANEPYQLDLTKITGSMNRLGFVIVARPRVPANRSLFVSIEARQNGDQVARFRQEYPHTLDASSSGMQLSDGLTITL